MHYPARGTNETRCTIYPKRVIHTVRLANGMPGTRTSRRFAAFIDSIYELTALMSMCDHILRLSWTKQYASSMALFSGEADKIAICHLQQRGGTWVAMNNGIPKTEQ